MNKKWIILILIIGIILVVIISSIAIYLVYFSWGADGNLALEISTDKNNIKLNKSFNVTLNLKNIGNTDLRVLQLESYFIPIITDMNGTIVWSYTIQEFDRGSLNNFDLKKLKSGSMISLQYNIEATSTRFDNNRSYFLHGEYYANPSDDGSIFLPYWRGTLESDSLLIKID